MPLVEIEAETAHGNARALHNILQGQGRVAIERQGRRIFLFDARRGSILAAVARKVAALLARQGRLPAHPALLDDNGPVIEAQVLAQPAARNVATVGHLGHGERRGAIKLHRGGILGDALRAGAMKHIIVDPQPAAHLLAPQQDVEVMHPHEVGQRRAVEPELAGHL